MDVFISTNIKGAFDKDIDSHRNRFQVIDQNQFMKPFGY
jgi:hypothetical protein